MKEETDNIMIVTREDMPKFLRRRFAETAMSAILQSGIELSILMKNVGNGNLNVASEKCINVPAQTAALAVRHADALLKALGYVIEPEGEETHG